jgi:hypothetical protein
MYSKLSPSVVFSQITFTNYRVNSTKCPIHPPTCGTYEINVPTNNTTPTVIPKTSCCWLQSELFGLNTCDGITIALYLPIYTIYTMHTHIRPCHSSLVRSKQRTKNKCNQHKEKPPKESNWWDRGRQRECHAGELCLVLAERITQKSMEAK